MRKSSSWISKLGPGFVTGASDDDPSGIATYAQAGAAFGFGALWFVLFSLPFMVAVQEMAARVALVTGRGLIRMLRSRFPRSAVFAIVLLLAAANATNIGADLGMMASAANRFVPVPFPVLLFGITAATLALQIFLPYRTYARYLKWLTLSLLAYVAVAFFIHVDWAGVLRATFLPAFRLTPDFILILVALLGTTISPYLYFWQANQEVEEEILDGHIKTNHGRLTLARPHHIRAMRFDVGAGMTSSNLIAWFIILTTGAVLFRAGGIEITSADQAARVLEPLVGSFASALFALGVVGTGLLAVPILSGTVAYALSELFDFKEGLSKTWLQARAFYAIITLITLAGLSVNFVGVNPVRLLIYAAVANGLIAPPILAALVVLSSDKNIMGRFCNGWISNVLGWGTVVLMTAAPLAWLVVSAA